jgi:hypothetical protein
MSETKELAQAARMVLPEERRKPSCFIEDGGSDWEPRPALKGREESPSEMAEGDLPFDYAPVSSDLNVLKLRSEQNAGEESDRNNRTEIGPHWSGPEMCNE